MHFHRKHFPLLLISWCIFFSLSLSLCTMCLWCNVLLTAISLSCSFSRISLCSLFLFLFFVTSFSSLPSSFRLHLPIPSFFPFSYFTLTCNWLFLLLLLLLHPLSVELDKSTSHLHALFVLTSVAGATCFFFSSTQLSSHSHLTNNSYSMWVVIRVQSYCFLGFFSNSATLLLLLMPLLLSFFLSFSHTLFPSPSLCVDVCKLPFAQSLTRLVIACVKNSPSGMWRVRRTEGRIYSSPPTVLSLTKTHTYTHTHLSCLFVCESLLSLYCSFANRSHLTHQLHQRTLRISLSLSLSPVCLCLCLTLSLSLSSHCPVCENMWT